MAATSSPSISERTTSTNERADLAPRVRARFLDSPAAIPDSLAPPCSPTISTISARYHPLPRWHRPALVRLGLRARLSARRVLALPLAFAEHRYKISAGGGRRFHHMGRGFRRDDRRPRWARRSFTRGTDLRATRSRLLRVWEGGMSSHGGILGLVLFTLFWRGGIRRRGRASATAWWSSRRSGSFSCGCANFVNGELWGKPSHRAVGGAVSGRCALRQRPPLEDIQHNPRRARGCGTLPPRHPSQIYEALLEGVLLFLVLWVLRTRFRLPRGVLTGCFFHPLRAAADHRGNLSRARSELGRVGPISAGQFLSLFLPLIGVCFIWWGYKTQQYEEALRR